MKDKLKKLIFAIFGEFNQIFQLLYHNIMELAKRFWRQSFKKRIIDIIVSIIIVTFISPVAGIIFSVSMSENLAELNTFQMVIFISILTIGSALIFINFAELFILLSLGGIAVVNTEFYNSINKRMELQNANLS